ncbi:Transport system permease protein OS=Tsukamurella paurometabola (strain ATCC 8368 / DSM / CCUG 35730 / CIP 100753 / JCM 10117 / KCTC 9821 / NBRC 16120 /NCIMB 702349 / NCTC 13040) OX=521096 GN=Tpau_3758 PE=3 SV=1 [Tsukamurella paurometabola]|uniref:Transport system permease protein n=1 Tax=Tsukamurella paurometabola (strain ATCC 8368 / DSM 20162 / CCUG 35730 / CIP 100753 / JCM 10117 / KCTC 9821 / NBRC 16120 / NCIMB 702349 / NCTC 13040) TaxID=521096 RepID=D5UYN3_TSUPD|nr:iron ABC transporter permease [Tsukamurella paurometabola]ADG80336.1 transport system permease protein [Tsukamurella paurometabola DSM 20162]SUP39285.1 Probable siderophore transport system permease protein yfiZ precursor [Tsukamurella paurometabola]
MTVDLSTTRDEPSAPAPPSAGAARRRKRLLGLLLLAILLVVTVVASLAIGSRDLAPSAVWDGLLYRYTTGPNPGDPQLNEAAIIVQTLRVPRTILALLAGAALALAGALLQGHTRNPIADPGILGITQGAAFAVVCAIFLGGLTQPLQYVWFAFLGAAVAAFVVFGLSSLGGGAASPLTLVLAGTGVGLFLSSMTSAIALSDNASLDALRFWNAGAVVGRGYDVIGAVTPFLVIGALLALANGPAVNLLNLGDDVARGLGLNVNLSRTVGVIAVTLLAGGATAACGSIAFLGLMVPHITRYFTGPDYRWLLPYSALLGAWLLLAADIVGRVVARPGELEVGIVVAMVGAPFFVALVWWRKAVKV